MIGPAARRVTRAAVVIGLITILFLAYGRQAAQALPGFVAWVQSLGAWGPLAYIAGYGIAAVLLLPCVLLTLSAGALWGVGQGLVYAVLGAALGATLAFLCARHLMQRYVQRYVDRHPRIAAIDRAVEIEGLRLVFLLRLSPVVPYTLLNYVLGVSRLRFLDYAGGLVGMVPAALMYVYAGKVAGDIATLASGTAVPRGTAYYVMLALGLVATVAASILIALAAKDRIKVS